MPRHLPFFPQGVTHITAELAFYEAGRPGDIFQRAHAGIHSRGERQGDVPDDGNAKQADIARVTTISVKRSVKRGIERRGLLGFAPPHARGSGLDRAGGGRDRGVPGSGAE